MPDQNQCWFTRTVLNVGREYGLTIDRREANALEQVLANCSTTAIS